MRQVGQMLRPTARAMRWSPMVVGAVAAAWVVVAMTEETCLGLPDASPCISDGVRVASLRVAILMLAVGSSFALDDPTEETTGHLPTPVWLRRVCRLVLLAPLMAGAWGVLVGLAFRDRIGRDPFPTGALTLEFAATLLLGFALAAAGARLAPDRLGGVVASPMLIGFAIVAMLLSGRWDLLILEPFGRGWGHSHFLWKGLLILGASGFVLASRGPYRRRSLRLSGQST